MKSLNQVIQNHPSPCHWQLANCGVQFLAMSKSGKVWPIQRWKRNFQPFFQDTYNMCYLATTKIHKNWVALSLQNIYILTILVLLKPFPILSYFGKTFLFPKNPFPSLICLATVAILCKHELTTNGNLIRLQKIFHMHKDLYTLFITSLIKSVSIS